MGEVPYIGLRLGDGPIILFEVSLLQLDVKDRLGKISTQSSKYAVADPGG